MSRHERRNRDFWDADADDYQAAHAADLDDAPRAWGAWRIPESELQVLGDVRDLDVLEYGCGAAQWSVALAADGARVVGLDQSRAQLAHASRRRDEHGVDVPLVCASGEAVPLARRVVRRRVLRPRRDVVLRSRPVGARSGPPAA